MRIVDVLTDLETWRILALCPACLEYALAQLTLHNNHISACSDTMWQQVALDLFNPCYLPLYVCSPVQHRSLTNHSRNCQHPRAGHLVRVPLLLQLFSETYLILGVDSRLTRRLAEEVLHLR